MFFQVPYVNSTLKNYFINIFSIILLIAFPKGLPNTVATSKMTPIQNEILFFRFLLQNQKRLSFLLLC